jgi:hypothetical protein
MSGVEAVRWAPRVPRATIRRLYEGDACGLVDEELVDDVAFAFYARVHERWRARVFHQRLDRPRPQPDTSKD